MSRWCSRTIPDPSEPCCCWRGAMRRSARGSPPSRRRSAPSPPIRTPWRSPSCSPRCIRPRATRAAATGTRDPRVVQQVAEFLLRQGKPEEAGALVKRLEDTPAGTAVRHAILGQIAAGRNQLGEAEQEFRAESQAAPSNADAHFALGQILLRQGSLDGARIEFESAANLNPRSARIEIALAAVHVRQRSYAKAEEAVRRALTITPGDFGASLLLGEILLARGSTD